MLDLFIFMLMMLDVNLSVLGLQLRILFCFILNGRSSGLKSLAVYVYRILKRIECWGKGLTGWSAGSACLMD